MKNFFTILTALVLTATLWAQSPEKMSYQAVVRDTDDNLVTNQSVGMQISILQGSSTGTAVYTETQAPTTNANGLVSIEIGDGTVVIGDFATIDWANGPYFIETETDPAGGTNYTITGTSQLLSVPFALHAKTAETFTGTITETDPVFTNSEAYNITAQDITDLGNLSGTNTGDQDISGITTNANNIATNVAAIALNTAKVGYTDALVSANPDVVANTAKVGLSPGTAPGQLQYWNGTAWVVVPAGNEGDLLTFTNNTPTWVGESNVSSVENPATGEIWMDRNLGASQVATSSNDAEAYGDLYQWGRGTDGHQIRTSDTTSTLSSSDTPGHGDFIITDDDLHDWRSPQNDNLWQGVSGINNPCPSGYRIPTEAEWGAERESWSSSNAAGAFASPLKLPVAGQRVFSDGSLENVNSVGNLWSSTVDGSTSRSVGYTGFFSYLGGNGRALGLSVRCIKD
jgi:hypothetical protein